MNDKFIVINEIKKFIIYVREIVINYPRREFILKDRIEKTSYEVLELVYLTNMLDFYMEISYNNRFISLKKLNQGMKLLDNIRKLVYGWIKSNGS